MTEAKTEPRVSATPAAARLLAEIVADHGPVLFHQSGGCCDGSSPMCYRQGEFLIGDRDLLLGEIDGTPFYIGAAQGALWAHTRLILDAVDGMGGMFSLDNGRGRRFLIRSDLCELPPPERRPEWGSSFGLGPPGRARPRKQR